VVEQRPWIGRTRSAGDQQVGDQAGPGDFREPLRAQVFLQLPEQFDQRRERDRSVS
jgi:hypothetical protein